jgi:hypothetical protein
LFCGFSKQIKKGQVKPVPSLKPHKVFLQAYFAAGASAGAMSFFSSFFIFFAFFIFFIFFFSAFAGAAFSALAPTGVAMGSAAIAVVQNAKTNATTNNAKRFIFKPSFLNYILFITTLNIKGL